MNKFTLYRLQSWRKCSCDNAIDLAHLSTPYTHANIGKKPPLINHQLNILVAKHDVVQQRESAQQRHLSPPIQTPHYQNQSENKKKRKRKRKRTRIVQVTENPIHSLLILRRFCFHSKNQTWSSLSAVRIASAMSLGEKPNAHRSNLNDDRREKTNSDLYHR